MKTEIVSFKIAKRLAELGYNVFNEECYFGYITELDRNNNPVCDSLYQKEYPTGKYSSQAVLICEKYKEYLAPTYQQLRKWFLQHKGIIYEIKREHNWENAYRAEAWNEKDMKLLCNSHLKDSYEDAEEDIVYKLLNLNIYDN